MREWRTRTRTRSLVRSFDPSIRCYGREDKTLPNWFEPDDEQATQLAITRRMETT